MANTIPSIRVTKIPKQPVFSLLVNRPIDRSNPKTHSYQVFHPDTHPLSHHHHPLTTPEGSSGISSITLEYLHYTVLYGASPAWTRFPLTIRHLPCPRIVQSTNNDDDDHDNVTMIMTYEATHNLVARFNTNWTTHAVNGVSRHPLAIVIRRHQFDSLNLILQLPVASLNGIIRIKMLLLLLLRFSLLLG